LISQYGSHHYARLHELDVDDVVHAESALSLLPEVGGFVYARLVQLPGSSHVDACTRPSVTGRPWPHDSDSQRRPDDAGSSKKKQKKEQQQNKFVLAPWSEELPAEGALVAGRVTNSAAGSGGVFVALGQGMSGRAPLRLLSDDFVETNQVFCFFGERKDVLFVV
jgi:hypothetical protein